MSIPLSTANEIYLQQIVDVGRFADQSAALDEAVQLLRRREELHQAVSAGVAELDRGEVIEYEAVELERFLVETRQNAARKQPT